MTDNASLVSDLRLVFVRSGTSWDDVVENALQVILFGSRAVGPHGPDSDWDLLCVGHGERIRRGELDLLWLTRSETRSKEWLGSELASHIAAFGKWIVGADDWSDMATISDEAIAKKRRHIEHRLAALARVWLHLSTAHKRRHTRLIRRQLQRLQLLERRQAVIPNPMLDREWRILLSENCGNLRLSAFAAVLGIDVEPITVLDRLQDA